MNAKFSHYVRQTLKAAQDLNAAVEKLYREHPSKQARELILDIYILQAERRKNIRHRQMKQCPYDYAYCRRDKHSQRDIAEKIMQQGEP